MTALGLEQLRAELDQLRSSVDHEVALGFRNARAYGDGSNNDEYYAVMEEQMVLSARIALLEEIVDRAIVVDKSEASDGIAAIGAGVLLRDLPSGTERRYRLANAHTGDVGSISAASPMGQALIGAAAGEVVTLVLPDGSTRSVQLLAVEPAISREELAA